MDSEIRPLGAGDYEAMIDLWTRAGLPHRPKGRDSRPSIIGQMARDPELFLGAFRNSVLIGCVIGTYDGRRGWVNRLAVDPRERRKGLARTLIEKIESRLRERGARIICSLVDEDNTPSLSLFEKSGYTIQRNILYLTKRESDQA